MVAMVNPKWPPEGHIGTWPPWIPVRDMVIGDAVRDMVTGDAVRDRMEQVLLLRHRYNP